MTVNAVGNLVTRGSDTFAYDQANRLTSATVAGVTETSTYDGDGVRFSRQVGAGPVIRSVSDVNRGLPVTIDDGSRTYVWGLGLAYAVAGSAVEVQHADRLGSVRALSDASGAVVATYRTDEWGVSTGASGSSGQPFGYTGEPVDTSGLSYLRARHYDPSLGRFLSRDPFAGFASDPFSLHRYAYVTNNPATSTDPSGLIGSGRPQGGPPSGKPRVLSCGGELHDPLSVGGFVNPLFDVADAAIYACEGDAVGVGLAGIGLVPVLGDLAKAVGKAVAKALLGSVVTRFVAGVDVVHHGTVILRGTVDLGPTLDRIASGTKTYAQDGRTFVNSADKLPSRELGYYPEWVVPTPGISGAGPQRIIKGAGELP